MSKEPMLPWGTSGLDPTKGLQERNLENLMKIFEKKEASEALTAMAKTDKETWKDINTSISDLNEFISRGGTGAIIESFKERVEESLKFILEDKLSTMRNTLEEIIATKLRDVLDLLDILSNKLATWFAENDTGAFIGALIGSLWGEGGEIIGGIIGAAIEELIQWMINKWNEFWAAPEEWDPYMLPLNPPTAPWYSTGSSANILRRYSLE